MEVKQARAVVVQLDLINLSCKAMDQLLVAVETGGVPLLRALARPLQTTTPLGTLLCLVLELMP